MGNEKKAYSLISVDRALEEDASDKKAAATASSAVQTISVTPCETLAEHKAPFDYVEKLCDSLGEHESVDVCSEKLAESKMKHKSVRVCSDTPSESEVEQESVSARSDSPSEPTAEKESVDDVIKREIQEQLGDGPSVPLARMRIIIIVVLVLFILAFGIYFALVM